MNQSDSPPGDAPALAQGQLESQRDSSQPPLSPEEAGAAEGPSLGPSPHHHHHCGQVKNSDIPRRDGLGVSFSNIYMYFLKNPPYFFNIYIYNLCMFRVATRAREQAGGGVMVLFCLFCFFNSVAHCSPGVWKTPVPAQHGGCGPKVQGRQLPGHSNRATLWLGEGLGWAGFGAFRRWWRHPQVSEPGGSSVHVPWLLSPHLCPAACPGAGCRNPRVPPARPAPPGSPSIPEPLQVSLGSPARKTSSSPSSFFFPGPRATLEAPRVLCLLPRSWGWKLAVLSRERGTAPR